MVERLDLEPPALREWLEWLKKSLGCGGAIESDTIVLQGDHRERLRPLLEARGIKRLSVG